MPHEKKKEKSIGRAALMEGTDNARHLENGEHVEGEKKKITFALVKSILSVPARGGGPHSRGARESLAHYCTLDERIFHAPCVFPPPDVRDPRADARARLIFLVVGKHAGEKHRLITRSLSQRENVAAISGDIFLTDPAGAIGFAKERDFAAGLLPSDDSI